MTNHWRKWKIVWAPPHGYAPGEAALAPSPWRREQTS